MKTFALTLAALLIVATAAFAYVQPGHLTQTPPPIAKVAIPTPGTGLGPPSSLVGVGRDPARGANQRARGADLPGGGTTNPVPEPGTIVLASMGLIALGAAARRRNLARRARA